MCILLCNSRFLSGLYLLAAVTSSGIVFVKQKVVVPFNFVKKGVIDFTKKKQKNKKTKNQNCCMMKNSLSKLKDFAICLKF